MNLVVLTFYIAYASIILLNNKKKRKGNKTKMNPEIGPTNLASWNQPRSHEELQDFISRHEATLESTED